MHCSSEVYKNDNIICVQTGVNSVTPTTTYNNIFYIITLQFSVHFGTRIIKK